MADMAIRFSGSQISGLKFKKRTHVFVGLYVRAPRKLSIAGGEVGKDPGAISRSHTGVESRFASLAIGHKLWVQEDLCALRDARLGTDTLSFRADHIGGRPPIPGSFKRDRYSVVQVPAKDCPRHLSRFTLTVTALDRKRCQDLTWDEIKAEAGLHYATDTPGQWWIRNYFTMPWIENPDVIGITFTCEAANIDGHPILGAKEEAERAARQAASRAQIDEIVQKKKDLD